LYSKANNDLIEVTPEVPENYISKYVDTLNYHIMMGYFPIVNDPTLTLKEGVG
jgi:hypothetical protein